MEVQSQEVKKLFEEYNKMVHAFDEKGGARSCHDMFNLDPVTLQTGNIFLHQIYFYLACC